MSLMKLKNLVTNNLMLAGGIIGVSGSAAIIFGILILLLRVKLAVAFLGARLLFELPWDQTDAAKIMMVTLFGLIVIAGGFILLFGALILLFLYLKPLLARINPAS